MRGYDEGVSAQIPLKLNTHVFLCASICVCIGLPRLVRTVINPASLKGDSSLKPRSLGPPTIVVSFLSHTHTKAPNRKQISPSFTWISTSLFFQLFPLQGSRCYKQALICWHHIFKHKFWNPEFQTTDEDARACLWQNGGIWSSAKNSGTACEGQLGTA